MGKFNKMVLLLILFFVSTSEGISSTVKIIKGNSPEMKFSFINYRDGFTKFDSKYWIATDSNLYGLDYHGQVVDKYGQSSFPNKYSYLPSKTFVINNKLYAQVVPKIYEKYGDGWKEATVYKGMRNQFQMCGMNNGKIAMCFDAKPRFCIYDPVNDSFDSLASIQLISNVSSVMSSVGDSVYFLDDFNKSFVKFNGKEFKSYNSLIFTKYGYTSAFETYSLHDTIWFIINETGYVKKCKICFYHSGKFGELPLPLADPLLKNMGIIRINSFAIDYKERFWFLISDSKDLAFHYKLYYLENGRMVDPFPDINEDNSLFIHRIFSIDKKIFASGGTSQGDFLLIYDDDPDGLSVEQERGARTFCFEGANPNPASEFTTVYYSADVDNSAVIHASVYDLFGREVKCRADLWNDFNAGTGYGRVEIDLSGLASGFYLVHINDGKANCSGSIIKRK